jgi:hypothetical protein
MANNQSDILVNSAQLGEEAFNVAGSWNALLV